jgi:hypothetical protein
MARSRVVQFAVAAALVSSAVAAQNVVTRESVVSATVERIERATRLVTLHGEQNEMLTVYVDPAVRTLDELQTGDRVTVRYVESVVVEVKPNAAPTDARDTTADAQKAGKKDVFEQQTAVVTIDSIDSQLQSVVYRNAAGDKMMRVVSDPRLLKGLRPGDRVRVTVTRERAIQIDRRR